MDLVVYKMENSLVKEFLEIMRKDYGEYKYENLGIKPYNQTHCQMHRLSNTNNPNCSSTYEHLVLPNLKKSQRLIDFGAGEQAYIKLLQSKKSTIGLRIPDNNIALDIVKALGNPILSASLPGEMVEEYTDPDLIYENFENLVDIVIDGGIGGMIPSTIIDCTTDDYELVRQGKGLWEFE
ncbi:MAG: hypothetical protein EAY68_08405 [Bacteroidetes bacterium]|nr:MAG: hypothetical protein EAY68_08405 [Bacteroidota bacterium]